MTTMDDAGFRRLVRQAIHQLPDDASDYAILAEIETAYHFYLLNRPAPGDDPPLAVRSRGPVPGVATRPFELREAREWPDGTKVIIVGVTAGHATDLMQEFYGAGPRPGLETGSDAGAWVTIASPDDVDFLAALFEGGYRLEVCEGKE